MLDVRTLLIVICITSFLLGIGWFVIWSAQRKLRGLRTFGVTLIMFSIGIALMSLRDIIDPFYSVILANFLINLGHVWIADGIARFLNQPRRWWVGGAAILITVTFWPLATYLAPENVGIRVAMAGLLLGSLFGVMALCFWRDRSLPRPLRWSMMALLSGHGAFLAVRGLLALFQDPTSDMVADENMLHGLFFLETLISMIFIFVGLVAMVAARLTADIQDKNRALTLEVDQRRALQEDLSASFAKERMLRQEQQYFLHMVSHEFRTPLAVIDRAAEMIGMLLSAPGAPVLTRIAAIRDAVRRLVILIDTFLSMERLDEGALRLEPLDMPAMIDEVRRHFAEHDAMARIVLHHQPDAVTTIEGDRTMLHTVLVNLVDNALKYSPAEEPVTLSLSTVGDRVTLRVEDNGIGIPRREVASVGTRFFRASNARAISGTGLGLYTARRLAETHGGQLSVDSDIGQGTRITLSLPKQQKAV
ncbi:sensor histidine kinase [Oceanibaculum pacificum]|uniref:histidine kinase n=1 Tax=Oceanibaculum pacificum TaxID=580166 RepID=A0A154W814_9PROT|nr:HAMP domain-containing sensor histidine kinase [Oceanibaculum pacificum]KZD09678.1 hypothetical protein AUP43_06945 [Oceanibaculum pacificum]